MANQGGMILEGISNIRNTLKNSERNLFIILYLHTYAGLTAFELLIITIIVQ